MDAAKKKKLLKILLPISIALVLISILTLYVALVCEHYKNTKTPLGWCIWEIRTHENYDGELTYIHQEIEPKSEIKKEADKGMNIYAYYITVFTEDRIGEWYCFIECYHRDFLDKIMDTKYYSANEVYAIDCDIVREDIFDERND